MPRFCIFAAVSIVTVPLQWGVGFLLAAAVHELGHCLALFLCGKKICQIRIDISGAQIHTEDMSGSDAVFCALAGPFAQLLLLPAAKVFPQMAVCAFVQALFNLLPVYPLDGGQALLGFARMLFRQDIADRLCRIIGLLAVVSSLCVVTILFASVKMLLLSVVCGVFFCVRILKIKRPCK